MKRIWALIFMSAAATWFLAGTAFGDEAPGLKAPAEEIVIEGEKKAARFSHPVHLSLGVTCGQCHHNSEHQALTDKDIEAMSDPMQLRCASCHNSEFADPKLQTPKDAFHARCKECHKTGVDGKTGPTKCTDCHVN
jgi:hypothetical protein